MLATVRVVVLADTHAPRRWKRCPPAVAPYLRGADLILHAGDVCTAGVLDELSGYAPVRAVRGNNDGPARRVRPLSHPAGRDRRGHPDVQPRLAHRPPPPAAPDHRPAAHRRRPP